MAVTARLRFYSVASDLGRGPSGKASSIRAHSLSLNVRLPAPAISPTCWRLEVFGIVKRPRMRNRNRRASDGAWHHAQPRPPAAIGRRRIANWAIIRRAVCHNRGAVLTAPVDQFIPDCSLLEMIENLFTAHGPRPKYREPPVSRQSKLLTPRKRIFTLARSFSNAVTVSARRGAPASVIAVQTISTQTREYHLARRDCAVSRSIATKHFGDQKDVVPAARYGPGYPLLRRSRPIISPPCLCESCQNRYPRAARRWRQHSDRGHRAKCLVRLPEPRVPSNRMVVFP
jgi:hypothetical protein